MIFKIGLEALYGYPERIFSYCEARDVRTFVDAKLHDIPRTVDAAVRQLVRPTYADSQRSRARWKRDDASCRRGGGQERADELAIATPLIFAVTILTSIAPEDFNELGLQGGPGENATRLAALARDAGLCGRRLQRARSARPQALLRRGFSRADARDSSGRRGARRSEAGRDARPKRSRRARIIWSSDVRSRRPPIRWRLPRRSSTKCAKSSRRDDGRTVSRRNWPSAERCSTGIFASARDVTAIASFRSFASSRTRRCVEPMARAIADAFAARKADVVVSAAVGGIVLGYEVARQSRHQSDLRREGERHAGVAPRLRADSASDRALIVEDVVTTGLSVERSDRRRAPPRRASRRRRRRSSCADRRNSVVPTHVLLDLPIVSYDPGACPLCAAGQPIDDPGSRRS